MVHIDVQVEHAGIHFEQFQDADNNVVDVAEATSLGFFPVMETSRPIYHQISLASYY
jgi:hypothetical protein